MEKQTDVNDDRCVRSIEFLMTEEYFLSSLSLFFILTHEKNQWKVSYHSHDALPDQVVSYKHI